MIYNKNIKKLKGGTKIKNIVDPYEKHVFIFIFNIIFYNMKKTDKNYAYLCFKKEN